MGDRLSGRRVSDAARASAIDRILAGESTVAAEALKNRVSRQAVNMWVTKAGRGKKKKKRSVFASSNRDDSDGSSGPDLERALSSAGLDQTRGDGEDGGSASSDTPHVEPGPAPTPEVLVALAEVVTGQLKRFYAGFAGCDITDPRVSDLFRFNVETRQSLELCAPYAAAYMPWVLGQSEKIGAIGFAAILAGSTWSDLKALKELAPREAEVVNPNVPTPAPAQPPRPASAKPLRAVPISGAPVNPAPVAPTTGRID